VLRQREVTALFTSAPHGHTTPTITPAIAAEVASLTDVSIVLRHVEQPGEIARVIAVLQTRGSAHDERVRQVSIDADGMHIGEPWPGPASIAPDSP
jgi:circadian clock protein KaiC